MLPTRTLLGFLFIGFLSVFLLACAETPPASNNNATPQTTAAASPTPQASPLVGFEKDLAYVRNGGYTYVFIFSRKDKKLLDKDDSAFLHTNAPQVVDWVITDDGKRVIAGTNFNLEEGNMDLLKKRFVVEDYSNK
jgi:hypothetical protein